jgi:hypothetical protein
LLLACAYFSSDSRVTFEGGLPAKVRPDAESGQRVARV